MNRVERAAYEKELIKHNVSPRIISLLLPTEEEKVKREELSPFKEGDKVRIKVQRIKSRKDFQAMSPNFRAFLDMNDGKTMTISDEKRADNMHSLKEYPEWLFWYEDLEMVNDASGAE